MIRDDRYKDISRLFRKSPHHDMIDFYGGIEGSVADIDMDAMDPEKINSDEYKSILFLENLFRSREKKDYKNSYEENAMTYLKRECLEYNVIQEHIDVFSDQKK